MFKIPKTVILEADKEIVKSVENFSEEMEKEADDKLRELFANIKRVFII
jgi:glutamate formiminotransferase